MTSNPSLPSTPTRAIPHHANGTPTHGEEHVSRSAPGEKDRSLKTALKASASGRTRSEDRAGPEDAKSKAKKDQPKVSHKPNGSSFGLSKASRGFFSKLTRSGSSSDKAGFEEEYDPKILKLPLIEQTRVTRIAKSYESCRDKTEFWMPALPWRCIDYLNGKCEDEGLYRVSGGVTNVRKWRRRFDIEHDINLLDEPDLYDSSVIASLFKEWIRELPEEIFPKPLQAKISATLPTEVPGKKPVPQSLRDELSNLPPFNYYLLFAITCHLSLLLSHEPKNKMTLDNLYRCFNQSLKLDGRIFYTLVGDWRQCWQGCFTENEFLRKEYEFLNTPFPEYPDLERRPPPAEAKPAEITETDPAANDLGITESSDGVPSLGPVVVGSPQLAPDEIPPETVPETAIESMQHVPEGLSPRAPALQEEPSPRAPALQEELSPRAPALKERLSPRAPAQELSPRASAADERLSPRAPTVEEELSPRAPASARFGAPEPQAAPEAPTTTGEQRPNTAHALLNRPTGSDLQAPQYDVQRSASDVTGIAAKLKAAVRPH
ncbi:Rho GTPase activation protein [Myriangium duriaei CBS 260.36]|uniref:Rho GTPase activation protein n=1 Tax=Myriangium duriaei CBS 260.36 TaxID=1168546 RepID=A0A9P4MS25_9PEZI|nr:Rho GTPase activation protein [Myriangium duriaei CBS 260.36]